MGEKMKGPALPQIMEERDRVTIRFGETEVIHTAAGIKIQAQYRNHPGFGSTDDSNK